METITDIGLTIFMYASYTLIAYMMLGIAFHPHQPSFLFAFVIVLVTRVLRYFITPVG
jgi:hypothetical protein